MGTASSVGAVRVGIDIGGTQTRVGRFAVPNVAEFALLAKFPTCQDYDEEMKKIAAVLRDVTLTGIGVAVGAQLARDGRSVHTAPNLPAYVGRPLADDLAARFGCPVRLAHDPVCGVLTEQHFGAIAAYDRSAYLTLSTGTGCAIQLRQGATVLTISIQVGHQILDGNALPCLCGQIGCLETLTGGRQIALHHGQPTTAIDDPAFWEQFCTKLALGLVNLAQLTRVEAVAVGGSIATNRAALLPQIQRDIDARINGATLTLLPAQFGDDAPLIGAALLLTTPAESIVH